MKKLIKIVIPIALSVIIFNAQAQPVYVENVGFKLESISNIDIGWMKIYNYTTPPKAKTLGNRVYSAKQIGYGQQFIEWMQQTYLPKGCLGDIGNYQNEIPKFSSTNSRLGNEINTNGHALPHMYGAGASMYTFLKKDAKGKFVPLFNFAEYWKLEVNQLQYISAPVSFISSPEEYYFLFPDYKDHPKGYNAGDKAAGNLSGFNTQKNLQTYKHFYIPPKTIDDFPYFLIIMTKNHRELPFEKVTIGEFFTQAEKQFPRWQKTAPVSAQDFALAQKNLARLKEKYRNKWNEVAELKIRGIAIDLYYFVNAREDNYDMFDNKDMNGKEGIYTTFPILKVKKTARALCKTDEPQWVVIRWTVGMPNHAFNMHLHESILNNFNFDYVYNYFFDPEKVKGQAYKPLRSPTFKEAVAVIEASEASKKIAAGKNIYFFDDFSTTASGKKPLHWQVKLANAGTTAVVTNPDGLEGNWVELRGHYIHASFLKNPLPQNFTLSYDLVATQNFTWGAKGLTMILSKETSPGNAESLLRLKLRPGSDGRDGEAELETKFPYPSGYSNGTKWYVANGFSNNKKNNRIAVMIKKTEETLQVFIDGNKIAEHLKSVPSAHLFNSLSFDCGGNKAENDKYYISNIKITKD